MPGRRAGVLAAKAVAAIATLVLAACGGGGGAPTEQDPDSGEVRMAPLALTVDNAGYVGGFSVYAVDMIAGLGQLAVDYVERAAPGRPYRYVGCSADQETIRHVDADGNGALSAGDRVEIVLAGCEPHAQINTRLDGEWQIRVLAASGGGADALRAEVRLLGGGLRLWDMSGPAAEVYVAGSFMLDWQRNATGSRLEIGATAADDLRREFRGGGTRTDRWRQPRVVRSIREDRARIEIEARISYESEDLKGRFELSTPAPVTSWINNYPEPRADQGRFRVTGADGDRVDVRLDAASETLVRLELDDGGDGSIEARGDVRWITVVEGHLWRDRYPAGTGPLDPRQSAFEMKAIFGLSPAVPVDDVLRVQFSRVPAAGTALRFRLVDGGRLPTGGGSGAEIPAEIVRDGAVVRIRPLQRLRYSNQYRVEVASGSEAFGGPVTVRDEAGAALSLPTGAVGSFVTPDELRPAVRVASEASLLAAGQTVRVSADGSMKPDRIVAYAWQQVDGPALEIASPAARDTDLRLVGEAPAYAVATLRLTLTHVDGATEAIDHPLTVIGAAPPASGWFYRLSAPAGAVAVGPVDIAGTDAGGQIFPTVAADGSGFGVSFVHGSGQTYAGWLVSMGLGSGVQLQTGRYADLPDPFSASTTLPPNVPHLSFMPLTRTCLPSLGTMDLHEFETGSDGTLTRLAADFAVSCGGGPVIRFWLRLNSARPLGG